MPETPEDLYARAVAALRLPPVETWETFPFEGDLQLRALLARVERAIRSIGEIGRVHVCRWGDGGEHLHWWFLARPARLPQLIGSFAAIWDDILPPTPEPIWRANIAAVVAALEGSR